MQMLTASAAPIEFDPGSYRDRTSRVFRRQGRIYRALTQASLEEWEAVHERPFFQQGMTSGRIVRSRRESGVEPPDGSGSWAAVLAHETIPFISYPYEWSFGMLRDAAELQLELLQQALADGIVLKDATPYNTQFRGSQCVFIDVPSFERHQDGQPWNGYRQFCQGFLYPLMLQAYRNVDFQPWLRGRLDGIAPQQFLDLLSLRDLARPGVLSHVYLHAKLERHVGDRTRRLPQSMQQHGFHKSLIEQNVRGLRKLVSRLNWQPAGSLWADYDASDSPAQVDGPEKEQFVGRVLARQRWNRVWDLGCNVGRYSRIAAEHADLVVALDVDHLAVERLYQSLKQKNDTRILPLVGNLADPSPGLGWRGQERRDLASRGRPDLILCLALIHHLVMRENVLLDDLVDWLADLGASLVIEFVDKSDPQVQSLLANRPDQYHDYTQERFEALIAKRFLVRHKERLNSGTRVLYYAEPLTSPTQNSSHDRSHTPAPAPTSRHSTHELLCSSTALPEGLRPGG